VVLKTWLFVDYTIRQLILATLNLPSVDKEGSTCAKIFCPRFLRCLNLVIKVRDVNRVLRRATPRIMLSGQILLYLHENEPRLLEQLEKAKRNFGESIGLPAEDASGALAVNTAELRNSRWVPDAWLDVTSRINTACQLAWRRHLGISNPMLKRHAGLRAGMRIPAM
jgi:hypothetical protein